MSKRGASSGGDGPHTVFAHFREAAAEAWASVTTEIERREDDQIRAQRDADKARPHHMKLYSNDLSPFTARARLAVYAKNLPVEVIIQRDTRSAEYLAINPMGRVPALVLDDGTVIPESDTIVEYLADAFPDAGLRPAKVADIARGRLLSRIAELYVMVSGRALFGQMDSKTRDDLAVANALVRMADGLAHLNAFMTGDRYAVGNVITTADCALVPMLTYVDLFGRVLGREDVLARHDRVDAYWARVRREPSAAKVIAEMHAALSGRGVGAPQ